MTENLDLDTSSAPFTLRKRNPDVLSCIANLSNDEVFTPPEFANRMLDTLAEGWAATNDGADIWSDPTVTFLDPFTKSGVFLREITKRLTAGLADSIPDLEERVDHILTKQVYGIAITEITALLARRSLYCSKYANGPHSIAKSFDHPDGNIWFERTEHTWVGGTEWVYTADENGNQVKQFTNGKCKFCGTRQAMLDRGTSAETHAYSLIHTDNAKHLVQAIFGDRMEFDVVIGNPPYQLADGGAGTSAIPIYHKFVEQSQALDPRFLIMVTPSRWIAGGKGLDAFRARMLADRRVRTLVDFINASEAFPGVDIAGGVSYFLWTRDSEGDCTVTTRNRGQVYGPVSRRLDEFDVFVRHAVAVDILHKIWPQGHDSGKSMAAQVSARKAFGFATNHRGVQNKSLLKNPVELVSSATTDSHREWVERDSVSNNQAWIDAWKTTVGGAAPAGGRPDKDGRYYGLSSIRVYGPGTVCTESYPVAGQFATEHEAQNLAIYLRTKFVRFLVSLRAVTQHVTRGSFAFVPIEDVSTAWTDEALYAKYGLTAEEQAYIESMIRPMEATTDG